MKTVIIGGVAAGASAAARLRRLDENAEIVLLERGAYISYANCGLPYHLSGVIPSRDALLVISEAKFAKRFNIDVRAHSEVVAINREKQTVTISLKGEKTYEESYDKLLIATGSYPIHMDLPGSDDPRIMQLWTIPDMDKIMRQIDAGAKKALVVGAGFIGLETAENLAEKGLDVTVVELAPQVLPTLDQEMSSFLGHELSHMGITLKLGHKVTNFVTDNNQLFAVLENNEKIEADLVIMSVGVKPNSELAVSAGLATGPRGHIIVNEWMQTHDPNIYAAGDAVEVIDPILGGKTAIPLAGPANKQGRMVADNIAGRSVKYKGSYGASVVKVGNLTAAAVGLTERRLQQANLPYEKIYTHPNSQAGYYPGGASFHIKLIFSPEGKIYGAQMVGHKGVDKRLDVISVAMQANMSVYDLAELELCYAPPYNSAKDPVNFAGMIAVNVLEGDSEVVHFNHLPKDAEIIDVREPEEIAVGALPVARNIPLESLREQLTSFDKSKTYITSCQVGLRGYIAERMMRQAGLKVKNASGGYLTWKMFYPDPFIPHKKESTSCSVVIKKDLDVLDVRHLACPGPIVQLKAKIDAMTENQHFLLIAQPTFENDLLTWSKNTGHTVVQIEHKESSIEALIRKQG